MNISELIKVCKDQVSDETFLGFASEESARITGTQCSMADLATPLLIIYCAEESGLLRGVAPITEGKNWNDAFSIAGKAIAINKKHLLAVFVMGTVRDPEVTVLGVSGRTLDGRSLFVAHPIDVIEDQCFIGIGEPVRLEDCDMALAVMNGYRQQWVLAEQAERPSEN